MFIGCNCREELSLNELQSSGYELPRYPATPRPATPSKQGGLSFLFFFFQLRKLKKLKKKKESGSRHYPILFFKNLGWDGRFSSNFRTPRPRDPDPPPFLLPALAIDASTTGPLGPRSPTPPLLFWRWRSRPPTPLPDTAPGVLVSLPRGSEGGGLEFFQIKFYFKILKF